MTREVNREYWQEYFDTYNRKRYDDLVNNFYLADATFQNPKYQMAGREAIARFFQEHHVDVDEELTPVTVIITPEVAALELDGVLSATKDLPDFYVMPMKQGVPVRMGMAAFYHLQGDRIAQVRIYWLKPAL
jgi:ketosteroid isomerase-like protein